MKRIYLLILGLCAPVILFAQASIRFKVPGKDLWGLKDRSGKTVVPATYYSIGNFKNGRYIIYKTSFETGMMNEYGQILLPPTYSSIYDLDSIVQVRKDGKSGILNRDLKEVLPLQYQHLQHFDSFYLAKYAGKFGVLNPDFSIAIPFEHGIVYHNSIYSRQFLLYDNGKYALADIRNKILIPQEYEFISGPEYGLYLGIKDGKITLFDDKGKKLWDSDYKDCIVLDADHIAVKNAEDIYGVVNRTGKIVIPFQYHRIGAINEGIYIAQNIRNLWGAVNATNKVVIPFDYAESFAFKKKIAPVKNSKQLYGYINTQGKPVMDFIYDKANPFSGDYARVTKNNLSGLVDVQGKEVLPLKYDIVSVVIDNHVYVIKNKEHFILDLSKPDAAVKKYDYIDIGDYLQHLLDEKADYPILARKKDGRYGYIDAKGKELTPFIYDNAGSFIDDHASVMYKGALVLIDKHGNILPER